MKLRIVLAGGGLCNIQVAKLIHDLLLTTCPDEVALTLISNYEYTYYSAMYPGLVSQQYLEEAIRVELRPLAIACNCQFVLGQIAAISYSQKIVRLCDETEIGFDLLSVNIGSQTKGKDHVRGLSQFAIMTRPLNVFLRKLETHENKLRADNESPRVAIVGAGASGVELAMVLHARFAAKYPGWDVGITIVDSHPQLFTGTNAIYREIVTKNLQSMGIKLINNGKVKEIRFNELWLSDGRILYTNLVIWATGPERQNIEHDLGTCPKGFIWVNRTMQCVRAPCVFAGGDCVTIKGFPAGFPPKTGAHALRQGPLIASNLIAIAKHFISRIPLSLMLYEPQADLLVLMNAGGGRGIASKYGMTFTGKWVFLLKDHMNKKFVKKYSPQKLLGEKGYVMYQELGSSDEVRELIYRSLITSEDEDYCLIDWYDYTRLSRDIDKEVCKLSPQLALNLILESSDTLKRSSCSDFDFQFSIFKRTDRDTEFRTEILRRYCEALDSFFRDNRPFGFA